MVVGWWFAMVQCTKIPLKSKVKVSQAIISSSCTHVSTNSFFGGLSVGQIAIDTANDLCNEGPQGADKEKHHRKGFLISFKRGMSHLQSCRFESKIGSPPPLGVFFGFRNANILLSSLAIVVSSTSYVSGVPLKIGDLWHICSSYFVPLMFMSQNFHDVHLPQWWGPLGIKQNPTFSKATAGVRCFNKVLAS